MATDREQDARIFHIAEGQVVLCATPDVAGQQSRTQALAKAMTCLF
jgi:hypothetical protein